MLKQLNSGAKQNRREVRMDLVEQASGIATDSAILATSRHALGRWGPESMRPCRCCRGSVHVTPWSTSPAVPGGAARTARGGKRSFRLQNSHLQ